MGWQCFFFFLVSVPQKKIHALKTFCKAFECSTSKITDGISSKHLPFLKKMPFHYQKSIKLKENKISSGKKVKSIVIIKCNFLRKWSVFGRIYQM